MHAELRPSKIVGNNLKRLIKESKYHTQESFAEAIQVDPRTLRKWLTNGIDSISSIVLAADILDVDVKALLF